jgi:hypothetical protein
VALEVLGPVLALPDGLVVFDRVENIAPAAAPGRWTDVGTRTWTPSTTTGVQPASASSHVAMRFDR